MASTWNASAESEEPGEGGREEPMTTVAAVPMTLIYALVLVTGLVGNVATCLVIARIRSMHTATNYYLFSLAMSDLLLLLLGLPQELYQLWVPSPYPLGEGFCVIRGLAAETSTNASVLLITAFTMERYLAICHPLRARTWSKPSRAVRLIGLTWTIAVTAALPVALQFGLTEPDDNCNVKHPLPHAFEISTFLFFCLPMTVISILYALIAIKLRMPRGHTHHPPSPSAGRERLSSSRRTVLKMLVAVVVAFFMCWAPFHAQRLLAIYASHPPSAAVMVTYNVLTHMSGILYYVSATINPILYHIMSLKFRRAFKDMLVRCCCCKRNQKPVASKSLSLRRLKSNGKTMPDNTDTTVVAGRGDSISNSSLRVTDDDSFTPQELSSMMAELNCHHGWRDLLNRHL